MILVWSEWGACASEVAREPDNCGPGSKLVFVLGPGPEGSVGDEATVGSCLGCAQARCIERCRLFAISPGYSQALTKLGRQWRAGSRVWAQIGLLAEV